MPREKIADFGVGLNTNDGNAFVSGQTLVSRNMMHNRGKNRAMTRDGTKRVWATATLTPTFNVFEHATLAGVVSRISKCGSRLESFSLTAATAKTTLKTGLSTSGPADIRNANGVLAVADQQAANYVSDGTAGNTMALQPVTATSALTPTEAGAVTGFGTGVFYVCYSFYNPTLDMESPPRAAESITKANANLGIRVTTPADPGSGFTTMRFYRTKVGEAKMYFAGSSTTFASTFDYTQLDTALGTGTFGESKLHNSDGVIVAAVPDAAKFAEWNKGFCFLGPQTSKPLRVVWSDLFRPTQFRTTSIAQAPAYYHDLEAGQGRTFTGMNSFDGSLVLFKNFSITVKNGDVDPGTFVWYVKVDGVGCVAPWTRAVAPGIGIFFCGADGIYLFTMEGCRKISDRADGSGIGDEYRALDFSKVEKWWGIWNERTRQYYCGVTTSSGTYCDTVYVYSFDSDTWATMDLCMALVETTCAGLITNSSGVPKVCIGTADGYLMETGISTLADAPPSGTITGTVTSVTGNHLNDSGAAFYASGDNLTGLVVTVRHSASSYESKVITGSTGTQIQVGSSWSATPTGKTYWVGAVRATLAFDSNDYGDASTKEINAVNGEWKIQSHSVPARVGWCVDYSSSPSFAGFEQTMKAARFSCPAQDRAVAFGPYFDVIGTSCPFELRLLEVDFEVYGSRLPAG